MKTYFVCSRCGKVSSEIEGWTEVKTQGGSSYLCDDENFEKESLNIPGA